MTSSRTIADEIENTLDYMLGNGISIYQRPVMRDAERVSWRPNSRTTPFLPARAQHSLALYRHWVESGHYSALLFDGSLLQLTYRWVKNVLVMHRLAYIPAPVVVDPDLLLEFPVFDVVEAELADLGRVRFAGAIRFEYDLITAGPGHPASHMTVNEVDCRIPCLTPVRLGMFMRFVLGHFYPEVWKDHEYFHALTTKPPGRRSITSDEASGLHLSWAT